VGAQWQSLHLEPRRRCEPIPRDRKGQGYLKRVRRRSKKLDEASVCLGTSYSGVAVVVGGELGFRPSPSKSELRGLLYIVVLALDVHRKEWI
jgi:hypothetical protein